MLIIQNQQNAWNMMGVYTHAESQIAMCSALFGKIAYHNIPNNATSTVLFGREAPTRGFNTSPKEKKFKTT